MALRDDNDCDGRVDEGYSSVATSCGTGVCEAAGVTSCVNGSIQDNCQEGDLNGGDDDCDGDDIPHKYLQ